MVENSEMVFCTPKPARIWAMRSWVSNSIPYSLSMRPRFSPCQSSS